jgi:hypothetical protein
MLGSDLGFTTARVRLRQMLFLAPPARATIERSVLAAQLTWGRASGGAPLDVLFAPGGGAEVDLPLRARRQKRGGVLGHAPLGRGVALANLEWRRRVGRLGPVQLGTVVFADAVRMSGQPVDGARRHFLDAGAGLRLGLAGVLVRLDYGRSVAGPRAGTLTAGIGQTF